MSKANLEGFRILIPTRGRVKQQTTYRSLPAPLQSITTLFSPSAETKQLRDLYPGIDVVAQPSSVTNIAQKRAWMMKYSAKHWPRVVMLDDDCYFFARCPATRRKWDEVRGYWIPDDGVKLLSVSYATPAKLVATFSELNYLLRGLSHGGICSRNGNHVERRELVNTSRMMHAIGYDTEQFARHVKTKDRVQVREDFDYTLQLLRKGHDNTVIYHTCVSPGSYGAKGGCYDERTVELSNREAHRLAELHPGLVRVVQKQYNNVPRMEVVVSWRKALGRG